MIGWFVAGTFVILTVPISMFGIFMHLHHWYRPELQRLVIRIIWLAPIYSITCWLALRFKDAAIYLNVGRECYEAWVLYSFTFFLIRCIGTNEEVVQLLIEKGEMHHIFPFCFLPKWGMGQEFLSKTRNGVLSFAVVKTILAFTAFILTALGKYGEGNLDPSQGYFWCTIINNFSCTWALYCLVQFYHVFSTDLEDKGIRPLPKFLCIKMVLFFSFWQSVLIAALVKFDVIKEDQTWTSGYTVDSVATGLQDFIICIEMFFAAIWHVYAFSCDEFMSEEQQRTKLTMCEKLKVLLDVSDVRRDVYEHITVVGGDVIDGAVVIAKAPVKIVTKAAKAVTGGKANRNDKEGSYVPPVPVVADVMEEEKDCVQGDASGVHMPELQANPVDSQSL